MLIGTFAAASGTNLRIVLGRLMTRRSTLQSPITGSCRCLSESQLESYSEWSATGCTLFQSLRLHRYQATLSTSCCSCLPDRERHSESGQAAQLEAEEPEDRLLDRRDLAGGDPTESGYVHVTGDFDFIFVTFEETASYLRAKGFNAHHIPAGIDCLRFCPVPGRQLPRSIDVLAMGRKPAETHRELFELAQHDKINYVYDTSSLPNVKDHVDHRTLMAKQVSRSKFFFVQRAKADVPHETQGQVELGSRYFEGCAAGAILVGERLDIQAFHDQFGWKDSVIQLDYNSSDISPIMKMLMADQDRLDQIHRRNVRSSLLKHDWSYRWESMLKTMGMEPSESLLARQNELRQRAFAIPTDDELKDAPSSVA